MSVPLILVIMVGLALTKSTRSRAFVLSGTLEALANRVCVCFVVLFTFI